MWDDLLALTARKWAMSCVFGHDKNRQEPGQYDTVYQSYRCHDQTSQDQVRTTRCNTLTIVTTKTARNQVSTTLRNTLTGVTTPTTLNQVRTHPPLFP